MKRELKRRKGEVLWQWCVRLANGNKDFEDILREVSKVSYIEGINTEREMQRKWRGWQ